MPRSYNVYGETLIRVKGGPQSSLITSTDLGLTNEPIVITPRFYHKDIPVDDFGPEVPAEILRMPVDISIQMTLVHYDATVLALCTRETLGNSPDILNLDGVLGSAGEPMGKALALFARGNRYISVNLISGLFLAQGKRPIRFRCCYLDGKPLEIPLGTTRTLVKLNWRCIPYVQPNSNDEILSEDAVLFDYLFDDAVGAT